MLIHSKWRYNSELTPCKVLSGLNNKSHSRFEMTDQSPSFCTRLLADSATPRTPVQTPHSCSSLVQTRQEALNAHQKQLCVKKRESALERGACPMSPLRAGGGGAPRAKGGRYGLFSLCLLILYREFTLSGFPVGCYQTEVLSDRGGVVSDRGGQLPNLTRMHRGTGLRSQTSIFPLSKTI